MTYGVPCIALNTTLMTWKRRRSLLGVGNTRFHRGTGGRMSAALPPPATPAPRARPRRPPPSLQPPRPRLLPCQLVTAPCSGTYVPRWGLPTSEAFYAVGLNLNISVGRGPACSRKVHCTAPRFRSVAATSCRASNCRAPDES